MNTEFEVQVTNDRKSSRSSKDIVSLVQQCKPISKGDVGAYLVGVFACQLLNNNKDSYDFKEKKQWRHCLYKEQWISALNGIDRFDHEQKKLILAGANLLEKYPHGWGERATQHSHVIKLLNSWNKENKSKENNLLLSIFPDEIDEPTGIFEGAKQQVTVNSYERNSAARQHCIEHYGVNCFICGFSFGDFYGGVANDFIHVHHLQPLSEIGEMYKIDPVQDLRPVCPNCHAVLHMRKNPPFSIEEIKVFIEKRTTKK